MSLRSLDDVLSEYTAERMPSADMVRQLDVVIRSFRRFANTARLDAITREVLIGWRDHLLCERNVKIATWNNYLRHLKVLLNFASETGCEIGHCLKGIKRLPDYRQAKRVLRDEDIRSVLDWLGQTEQANMQGWFWASVCRVLFYSGIRRRQLVGLRWRDIHWYEGSIQLRADTSKTKVAWMIPLTPPLRQVLECMHREAKVRLGRECLPNEQVFNITLFNPRYKGRSMTAGHVSAAFRRIREQTGIDISAHRFRHTFASKLAKQGRVKELQQVLGHTDVRTTLGYVQPDMGGMAEMMSGLNLI